MNTVEQWLAAGNKPKVLPMGFTHFKDGIVPQSAVKPILNEQDRIDREKAIEAKNQEIRDYKAALKEQRRLEAKQKFKSQTDEQIRVLGEFVRKSSGNKQDFERLAEMAGYRVRHLRDAAKGHSKLGDEKWALIKKLIKAFKFEVAA